MRVGAMLTSIQEAIGHGVAQGLFKPVDAGKYAVTVAGASLAWVTARPVVRRSLRFDPLSTEHLEDYRLLLVQLTRQMLEAPAPRTSCPQLARATNSRPRAARDGE